ncbi:MAG: hypothetical protein HY537_07010 [Deltaproteobacteria bacterium]|nr:hypothetical protein [Deltaproteobacteria bacterium]
MESTLIFRTTQTIAGVYDSLLGGVFVRPGTPEIALSLFGGFFLIACTAVAVEHLTGKRRFGHLALFCSIACFVILNFLLNQPWDELFVNLRHSLHFAESNNFSFNRTQNIEAIVDFLPFFVIGLLGKLGFSLMAMALIQSCLGGLLCILAFKYFLGSLGARGAIQSACILGFSLYPPLVFNSAQGFATSLFSAAILWAIVLLYFSERKHLAFLLLALIPLIRIEGLMVVGLLYGHFMWQHAFSKPSSERLRMGARMIIVGLLILVPTLLLSIYRLMEFGSPLAVCVKYKSAFGNFHYLKLGIRNLIKDLHAAYVPPLLVAFAIGLLRFKHPVLKRLIAPLLILCLFITPYYLSGGDWFPPFWGRYLLPLSLFCMFCIGSLVCLAIKDSAPGVFRLMGSLLAAISFGYYLSPFSHGLAVMKQQLASINVGMGSLRIQDLSMIGKHLERTTHPSDVVASAEVATLMYFSRREALDLLGIANPEIASQPSTLTSNLAYRKRNPSLVAKYQPAIVWLYDFTTLGRQDRPDRQIIENLKQLERDYSPANEYRVGGVGALRKLGYQPIAVFYGNNFSTLYFVASHAVKSHVQKLKQLGFRMSSP